MSRYRIADREFTTKKMLTEHIRSVRDTTPLHAPIDDPVVLWLLRRHPEWEQKSQKMSFVGTALIQGSPAAPPSKQIAIIRSEGEPMDISWTKLVARLQRDGTLRHPTAADECLAELRIAARLEIDDQIDTLRVAGMHVDHAFPLTFEQLLFDWVCSTGLELKQITVESNDGPTVLRWLADRALAESWRAYHRAHAVLVLRTPAEHAAEPKHRVDWSSYLEQ